jgi:hypothetical protein
MHITFWFVSLKGRDHSEDVGVDWGIIFNGSLGNKFGKCELHSFGSG